MHPLRDLITNIPVYRHTEIMCVYMHAEILLRYCFPVVCRGGGPHWEQRRGSFVGACDHQNSIEDTRVPQKRDKCTCEASQFRRRGNEKDFITTGIMLSSPSTSVLSSKLGPLSPINKPWLSGCLLRRPCFAAPTTGLMDQRVRKGQTMSHYRILQKKRQHIWDVN